MMYNNTFFLYTNRNQSMFVILMTTTSTQIASQKASITFPLEMPKIPIDVYLLHTPNTI